MTCYLLGDGNGSKRMVMNGSGGVMARHDYLPYGEEVQAGTGLRTSGQGYGVTDDARKRYARMEKDEATNLEHAQWRKMESRAGRWTTPDPYKGSMSIGDPQSMNRYAYVGNDPVNHADPSGLFYSPPFPINIGTFNVTVTAGPELIGGSSIKDANTSCSACSQSATSSPGLPPRTCDSSYARLAIFSRTSKACRTR